MHFHHSGVEFVACQVVNGIFKIWFKATECNIRRKDSVLGCGGAGPTEIWSESHFLLQMWFWSDFQNLLLYLFCLAVHTLISQETLELAKKMICAGSLFFFFARQHHITLLTVLTSLCCPVSLYNFVDKTSSLLSADRRLIITTGENLTLSRKVVFPQASVKHLQNVIWPNNSLLFDISGLPAEWVSHFLWDHCITVSQMTQPV